MFSAADRGEEGFGLLRGEIVDNVLAAGRLRLDAPEQLLDGEFWAIGPDPRPLWCGHLAPEG